MLNTVTTTKFLLGLALGVGLPVWLTQSKPEPSTLVTLDYATFNGAEDGQLTSFLGMPFAQPPVGNLRFARPKPPLPITGTYNATKYGPACYSQSLSMRNANGSVVRSSFHVPPDQLSEDCLSINVIKPANALPNAKLPVLFSIHGGGFAAGTTSVLDFGVPLVTRALKLGLPMIYVSANYRLTAFGFLAGEEVSEEGNLNAGLYDQRMALEWVQKYIEHFGGDPTKVIIAGSISVGLHMVADGAENDRLFRGAILRSAAPLRLSHYSSTKTKSYITELAHHAECPSSSTKSTLECLRAVPAKRLVDAINQTPDLMGYESVGVAWKPRREGRTAKGGRNLWSEQPWRVIESGRTAKVPFVITSNDDEGTMFSLSSLNVTTNEQFKEYVQLLTGVNPQQAEEIAKVYPEDPAQGSPFGTGEKYALSPQYKRISALIGDISYHAPHRLFLENLARKQGVPAWAYVFKAGKNKSALGSYHMMDTGSILFTESGFDFMINFAHTLNPNTRPLPNPLHYLKAPALFISALKSISTPSSLVSTATSHFSSLISYPPFSGLFPNHTTLPYYWPTYSTSSDNEVSGVILTFHDASPEDAHLASKELAPGVPADLLYKEQNEDTGLGNLGTVRKPRLWKVDVEVDRERTEARDVLINVLKEITDE